MHRRKLPATLVPLLLLALSACGPEDDVPLIAMDPTLEARMASEGFRYGEYAQWPEDIPPEIPPLEGEIRVVKVIPGVQYRIDYSSVSEQAMAEYLVQLESQGFQLQYLVYSAPSIPDEDTAARIARGEWDAVEITKGPYRMRLEAGDPGANLDIDNADFMTPGPEPRITPTPLVWPSDIPGRVPQPAACQMTSLAELGGEYAGGYQIMFDCTDPLVQEHFVEALLAAGFTEIDRLVSDTGQNVYITLEDREVAVKVGSVVGTSFVITVWPGNGPMGTPAIWATTTPVSLPMASSAAPPTAVLVAWPSDIPAQIPPPASCKIISVGNTTQGGYLIGLECLDPMADEGYVEALLAAGLTETRRFVTDAGAVVQVTLRDSETEVTVMPSMVGPGFAIQLQLLGQ